MMLCQTQFVQGLNKSLFPGPQGATRKRHALLAETCDSSPKRQQDEHDCEKLLHYSSGLKSVMRTPPASSIITISPNPISVPPMKMSMFSPADRVMRSTLSASRSQISLI